MGAEIVNAITSVFSTLGQAIMTLLKEGFTTLFYDVSSNTKTVSDIAIFIFVGLGISLCVGLTRWITSLVRKKI